MDEAQRRVESIVRGLITLSSRLPSRDIERIVESIASEEHLDLAVAYSAAASRLASRWLRWEWLCKERGVEETCSEVEEEVSRHGEGLGVVTYFNVEFKSIIVRMYRDLSPGVAVPRWVLMYAVRLEIPLVTILGGLSRAEQAARLPAFASALLYLDAVARGLYDFYNERGAQVASATAAYLYWEVLRPCTVFADAAARVLAAHRAYEVWRRVREETRERGEPPPPRRSIEEACSIFSRELLRQLSERRRRSEAAGGEGPS